MIRGFSRVIEIGELTMNKKSYKKPELKKRGSLKKIIRGTTGIFSDGIGPFNLPG